MIDCVEVIRCKDCIHYDHGYYETRDALETATTGWCNGWTDELKSCYACEVPNDGYCFRAERRDAS